MLTTLEATTLNHRILKRKVIWFNPPCSMNVETNIGKTFLKLVKKRFPRHNFHNIFNKNTMKISYSCMRNISLIIASNNKSILRPEATEYGCNCRKKESCPLQNQSLTPKVIYETTVVKIVTTKNGYTLAFQIEPLRSDIATIHETLITTATLNLQSYRSTFGS